VLNQSFKFRLYAINEEKSSLSQNVGCRLVSNLGLLFILAGSAPALAASNTPTVAPPPATASTWTGGPQRDGKGRLSLCAVEGRFDNGLTLAVTVNPLAEVGFAIALPTSAAIQVGSTHAVAIQVDTAPAKHRDAVALKSTLLAIKVGREPGFLESLYAGTKITFTSDTDAVTFSLAGMRGASQGMKACLDNSR
jgi:hypothetical protein